MILEIERVQMEEKEPVCLFCIYARYPVCKHSTRRPTAI